jgi:hypothetical protein
MPKLIAFCESEFFITSLSKPNPNPPTDETAKLLAFIAIFIFCYFYLWPKTILIPQLYYP